MSHPLLYSKEPKRKVKVVVSHSLWVNASIFSFVCGIVARFFLSDILPYSLLLIGVSLAVMIAIQHKKIVVFSSVLFLCFLLGVMRMSWATHEKDPNTIDYYTGQQSIITGIITDPPDKRATKTQLVVETSHIKTVTENKDVHGKILITTTPIIPFDYGDQIRIEGKLLTPKDSPTFTYRSYLAKDDIYTLMETPSLQKIGAGKENPLYPILYHLRDSMEHSIESLYPEPSASLLSGLLLGLRKTMPKEVTSNLQTTGTIHIIAISGFNITILISFIAGILLSRFQRKIRFIGATSIIILFTLLVGASASVVRAAIMGIIGLFALSVGRKADAVSALLIALVVMAMIQPTSLILDIGLQLSFLATLGLIYFTPIFENFFTNMPTLWGIKNVLIATLSAQIMVLPLLLFSFEKLSLIAPLCNILILWIIPITMLIGFISLLIGIIPFLFLIAKLIAFFGWFCLEYILKIIFMGANIPFASIDLPWWNTIFSVIFFIILILLIISHSLYGHKKEPRKE